MIDGGANEKETSDKELSPLAQIINDLFREVVLPNLLDIGEWNQTYRKSIENALADVQTSMIVRYVSRPTNHLLVNNF